MGVTGRYDFKGIQKLVSVGINAFLATTAWGAWLLASPFRVVLQAAEDAAVNFLTNRGLIILNIGAIVIDGVVDQTALDGALSVALQKLQQGRDKITPAAGKALDDAVRKAFDEAASLGATNANSNSVPDVPASSLRSGSDPSV